MQVSIDSQLAGVLIFVHVVHGQIQADNTNVETTELKRAVFLISRKQKNFNLHSASQTSLNKPVFSFFLLIHREGDPRNGNIGR